MNFEESTSKQILFWSLTTDQALGFLQTSSSGLSQEEASSRLTSLGNNELSTSSSLTGWRIFLNQLRNPLLWILVFACAVSILSGEWIDAVIVAAIALGSVFLSFTQEFRASAAINRLMERIAFTVTCLRDGTPTEIPAREIVPGDVVILNAGTLIPGDGLILESKDLFVIESALTGESLPVEKHVGLCPENTPLSQQENSLFMGTSVRSGRAKMLVVHTGIKTQYGKIAKNLEGRHVDTDFEKGLARFGMTLTKVMVLFVLIISFGNFWFHKPFVDSLLFAIAIAVGLSPELLPAVLSVTLSRGALKMSQKGVLVRRLNSIETFGSINVLCCDKTGTLTSGQMSLTDCLGSEGLSSALVGRLSYANAFFQTGIRNPLDDCIMNHFSKEPWAKDIVLAFAKVDEISYDFERKRLSVAVQEKGSPSELLITKGAALSVLSVCKFMQTQGGQVPIQNEDRLKLDSQISDWGKKGLRVLALATKQFSQKKVYQQGDEVEMTLEGFLVFQDPPHPDAQQAVNRLEQLGVDIRIVTGDNRYVSLEVAKAVGLKNVNLLTGEEMRALDQATLASVIQNTKLFAEVDPQQKELIISSLRRNDNVVGYLGDGINDAPALKTADVGISVETAVDVAKETADIVLEKHNLLYISEGIFESRKTFANTLKYIFITSSANFGNMLSMAIASFYLPFLPLLATQILWNNFLSDLPSLFIATDNVDLEWLEKPLRWNITEVKRVMMGFGLISSLFDLTTFAVLIYVFKSGESAFQTAWFIESLLTELLIIFVVRSRHGIFKSVPSSKLIVASLAVGLIALFSPVLPFAELLKFSPLPPLMLLCLVGISLSYTLISELAKKWIFAVGSSE